jgi:short-chain fatty acids transporter
VLQSIGSVCVRIAGQLIPNPFVFAIILSAVVYLLGITLTDTGPIQMVGHWYGGFWNLLQFGMQMLLILLFGYVLASSPPVRRVVAWAGRIPQNPGQAILLITVLAMVSAYVNWGLGLIVGAIAAREVCVQAKRRGIKVHYPLAAAAGFSSLMVFAGGFSASAPLLVNSDTHFLFKEIGRIPVTDTILAPYNLIAVLAWMLIMPFVYRAMHPKAEDTEEVEISEESDPYARKGSSSVHSHAAMQAREQTDILDDGPGARSALAGAAAGGTTVAMGAPFLSSGPNTTLAEWLENSAALTWIIAVAGLGYIGYYFSSKGFDLNPNIVNFTLLIAGMIAHKTPIAYVRAVDDGIRACGQVALQFPFYAGIMGMMAGSGLVSVLAGWLIAVSTEFTLPLTTLISAAIVNIFVPSAGGQWAIQGPLLMEAAKELGANPGLIIMAFTHGDQLTNGIQPMWMLPLLGVTALKVSQVVGYTAVVMFVAFFIWAIGVTLLPLLFL